MNSPIRAPLLVALLTMLTACASTDPRDGASIQYRFPRTDAVAKLTLTLTECANGGYLGTAGVTITAKPGADATWYQVSGKDLASFKIKRSLQINVSDDGVITAVNTTNTDQTAAIVENVGKILGIVASMAFAKQPTIIDKDCKGAFLAANAAIEYARTLQTTIEENRKKIEALPTQEGAERVKLIKEVNKLAKELVTIRQDFLKVETTGPIKLEGELPTSEKPKLVELETEPFEKWSDLDALDRLAREPKDNKKRSGEEEKKLADQKANVRKQSNEDATAFARLTPAKRKETTTAKFDDYLKLKWTAAEVPTPVTELQPPRTDEPSEPAEPPPCDLLLRVPKVTMVNVNVTGAGSILAPLEINEELLVPAAQRHSPANVCLDVGYGESRTVGLKFDKFGRTTEFVWSSDATGANVTASLAGSAEAASGILATLRGPSDLDKMKKQLDELDTQQKLNKLLACKAIIEAGGFNCDEEEKE